MIPGKDTAGDKVMRYTVHGLLAAGAAGFLLAAHANAPAQPAQSPPGFGWPHNPNTYRVTSAFDLDRRSGPRADWMGWRSGDPTAGSGHAYNLHSGTDTGMPNGTPLYAVANGTLTSRYMDFPRNDNSAGGNYLFTSHSMGGHTYRVNFWHLDYQGVIPGPGQSVTKGQHIAYSNNTGNSTGPHLHLGVARSSATNLWTCPYYHGWWEDDEFYWGDTRATLRYVRVNSAVLNTRLGNTTGYSIITQLPQDHIFVATQHNNWHRVLLPLPPAMAHESRTPAGSLAEGYAEQGTWMGSLSKSTAEKPMGDANRVVLHGTGSRYTEFETTGSAANVATFTFTAPQRGNYIVATTWPSEANAENVAYRVTHSGGTAGIFLDQRGDSSQNGTGLHADPYIIETNPYVAHHTTIGGDSIWNSYSPAGAGLPEFGPERIYKFTVHTNTRIRASVDHTGYPGKDVDIHLLGSMSNTDCLIRADWSFEYDLTPGTYYISVDSYGNDASRATDYTITVEFDKSEPFANSWVSLGEYHFDYGQEYYVQVREQSVTGPVDPSRPGRVYADAVKLIPIATHRSGFISSGSAFSEVVSTSVEPICSVVVHTDRLSGNDSRDIADYHEVPVYASRGTGTQNNSPVVAKAVTGHRFVVSERTEDGWYKVHLTNAAGATKGWISGKDLYIYNPEAAPLAADVDHSIWIVH